MLVVILGTRWSGKASLASVLEGKSFNVLTLYSTQKLRAWDNTNITHVSSEEFFDMARNNEFIEAERFSPYGSTKLYAVKQQDVMDTVKGVHCLVLDFGSAKYLSEFCTEHNVPVRLVNLYAQDTDLTNRAIDTFMANLEQTDKDATLTSSFLLSLKDKVKGMVNKLLFSILADNNWSLEKEFHKNHDHNFKNMLTYNTSYIPLDEIANDIVRNIIGDNHAK